MLSVIVIASFDKIIAAGEPVENFDNHKARSSSEFKLQLALSAE
jgi:hypothetical protein